MRLFTSFLFALGLLSAHAPLCGQEERIDSLRLNRTEVNKQLLHGVKMAAPIVGAGFLQTLNNQYVRELRFAYYPRFRHRYDDYLQFVPLAGQLGLRLAGVRGVTDNLLQMASADAVASLTMLALTSAIKYTARVERPDGSSRNSFPSGHTTMAFTSAELLNIEYGDRFPWLRPISYTVATATGVGRLLNNRHWIGDVVTGAGLGILSAHFGYWATDLLFGRSRRNHIPSPLFPREGFLLYLPIESGTLHTKRGAEWYAVSRAFGLGVEYTPPSFPLFLQAQAQLALHRIYRHSKTGEELGAELKGLRLQLGLGKDFSIWEDFGLNVSTHARLMRYVGQDVVRPEEIQRVTVPRWRIGMGIELAPHWQFTRHLGIRVPCGVDYFPSSLRFMPLGGEEVRLRGLSYYLSASLEVHL